MTSTTPNPFEARLVGGVPFQTSTLDDAAAWILREAVPRGLPVNIRLANAWNVALANKDDDYLRVLRMEGVNFPDGKPVVWAMNAGLPAVDAASRVRGPSLFKEVLHRSDSTIKHFLLGSTEETLARLQSAIARSYANADIVGAYSPPFAEISEEYIENCADRVRGTGANIVWVGLGTPKQDHLGTALATRLRTPCVNVGAAFDFVAGTSREAPQWVQNSGFEWLYRFAQEPRRLWRRYLIGNVQFVHAVLRGRKRSR